MRQNKMIQSYGIKAPEFQITKPDEDTTKLPKRDQTIGIKISSPNTPLNQEKEITRFNIQEL